MKYFILMDKYEHRLLFFENVTGKIIFCEKPRFSTPIEADKYSGFLKPNEQDPKQILS